MWRQIPEQTRSEVVFGVMSSGRQTIRQLLRNLSMAFRADAGREGSRAPVAMVMPKVAKRIDTQNCTADIQLPSILAARGGGFHRQAHHDPLILQIYLPTKREELGPPGQIQLGGYSRPVNILWSTGSHPRVLVSASLPQKRGNAESLQ